MRTIVLTLCLLATPAPALMAAESGEVPAQTPGQPPEQVIAATLRQQFERPAAPLQVAPVAVAGTWAVAGWAQEGRGGRALLHLDNGRWEVRACAGDALRDAATLAESGLEPAVAQSLAQRLRSAEESLPASYLRQLSTFQGVVHMGPHGHGASPKDAAGHITGTSP